MLWDLDAMSLYPSALWDESSIYPWIETGYAYTNGMNDEFVEKFNSGRFTKGSAISKKKYYELKHLVVHHLPVKERENKIEINHMRNG